MNHLSNKTNPARPSTHTRCILLVGLWVCLGLAGCYPDASQGANNLNLQLELDSLGISAQQQSLDNWISWLTTGRQSGQPYQMGGVGFDFVLAIDLYAADSTTKVSFEPKSIKLQKTVDQTDVLTVDTTLSECYGCWFDMVLFWIDQVDTNPTLLTLWGSSTTFDFDQTSQQNELVMDIYLQPVGEVLCKTGSPLPAQARLAARDVKQNVRFEPVVSGQTQTLLPNLPIQRDLLIELDPSGNGDWQAIAQVNLTSEGQQRTVQLP